jgi:hypothetical protein
VFYFMAVAALLLALVAGARHLMAVAPPHLARPFAILAPQAAALAHDQLSGSGEPSLPDATAAASADR